MRGLERVFDFFKGGFLKGLKRAFKGFVKGFKAVFELFEKGVGFLASERDFELEFFGGFERGLGHLGSSQRVQSDNSQSGELEQGVVRAIDRARRFWAAIREVHKLETLYPTGPVLSPCWAGSA